jgi:hypothetical protein
MKFQWFAFGGFFLFFNLEESKQGKSLEFIHIQSTFDMTIKRKANYFLFTGKKETHFLLILLGVYRENK